MLERAEGSWRRFNESLGLGLGLGLWGGSSLGALVISGFRVTGCPQPFGRFALSPFETLNPRVPDHYNSLHRHETVQELQAEHREFAESLTEPLCGFVPRSSLKSTRSFCCVVCASQDEAGLPDRRETDFSKLAFKNALNPEP